MKTSNKFRFAAFMLLLGLPAVLIDGQNSGVAFADLYPDNNESVGNSFHLSGLTTEMITWLRNSEPESDFTVAYENESHNTMENRGYWIDAVMVSYDNKKEVKNVETNMGYLIDPVTVTYYSNKETEEVSGIPADLESARMELPLDMHSNELNYPGYWIDPVVITVGTEDTQNSFRKDTKFVRSEMLPCAEDGVDLRSSVQQKMKYPECAIAKKIEGEVIIEFTVDAEGNVTNTKVLKDIGGNCGMYAASAVASMKFKPAMQNGYSVPCKLQVPVQFRLL